MVNWHKVMIGAATTLTATGLPMATAGSDTSTKVIGIVLVALGFVAAYLTRPSQTSAVVEKISDAIPGNTQPSEPPGT